MFCEAGFANNFEYICRFETHFKTSDDAKWSYKKISCKALRNSYPSYFMSKNKIQLTPRINVDHILEMMANKYCGEEVNTIDGVKIDFEQQWVHLRKSNTEPIIRIYTESNSQQSADELAERFITEITEIIS